jgi:hypothetical protein
MHARGDITPKKVIKKPTIIESIVDRGKTKQIVQSE